MDSTLAWWRRPMVLRGYPAGLGVVLGAILLVCLAAYVVPRTVVPGAILLTGDRGGAVATQLRVGDPLFRHVP